MCQCFLKMYVVGERPGATLLGWRYFLSLTSRQYLLKTSRGALFLPPSDVYVRSFLYLFYTLIKFYYTKSLSDQALLLAPDRILLLSRTRIPASFMAQQQHITRILEQASASTLGTHTCLPVPPMSPASAITSDMLRALGPLWSSASEGVCICQGRVGF